MDVTITHIDTACCLIEVEGFRILTDPVFDLPGHWYHHGWGAFSRKTSTPRLDAASLGRIDLVLLSHHQHKDNLDNAGKTILDRGMPVVSTRAAAKKLPNTTGLAPWETTELAINGKKLRITGTPCRHHPPFLPGFFSGPVTGFVLQWEGCTEAIYISGDTVLYSPLYEVGNRFSIGIALIHVGRATFPWLTGPGKYTMDGKDFIKLVEQMHPRVAIPIHNGGWTHFKESDGSLSSKLDHKPATKEIVTFPGAGVPRSFELK